MGTDCDCGAQSSSSTSRKDRSRSVASGQRPAASGERSGERSARSAEVRGDEAAGGEFGGQRNGWVERTGSAAQRSAAVAAGRWGVGVGGCRAPGLEPVCGATASYWYSSDARRRCAGGAQAVRRRCAAPRTVGWPACSPRQQPRPGQSSGQRPTAHGLRGGGGGRGGRGGRGRVRSRGHLRTAAAACTTTAPRRALLAVTPAAWDTRAAARFAAGTPPILARQQRARREAVGRDGETRRTATGTRTGTGTGTGTAHGGTAEGAQGNSRQQQATAPCARSAPHRAGQLATCRVRGLDAEK